MPIFLCFIEENLNSTCNYERKLLYASFNFNYSFDVNKCPALKLVNVFYPEKLL